MTINIDEKSLEKALSERQLKEKPTENAGISKEEEIGFHKGALNTLISERNELIKMISNVEAILQAHLKRLEELGVKISREEKR